MHDGTPTVQAIQEANTEISNNNDNSNNNVIVKRIKIWQSNYGPLRCVLGEESRSGNYSGLREGNLQWFTGRGTTVVYGKGIYSGLREGELQWFTGRGTTVVYGKGEAAGLEGEIEHGNTVTLESHSHHIERH